MRGREKAVLRPGKLNPCTDCGTYAAFCPSAAASAGHFSDDRTFAEIEGHLL